MTVLLGVVARTRSETDREAKKCSSLAMECFGKLEIYVEIRRRF